MGIIPLLADFDGTIASNRPGKYNVSSAAGVSSSPTRVESKLAPAPPRVDRVLSMLLLLLLLLLLLFDSNDNDGCCPNDCVL